MRIPCHGWRTLRVGLLASVLGACGGDPPVEAAGTLDPAACRLWAEYAAREADPIAALRAEAHRSGERLRTGLESGEAWEEESRRLPPLALAPACSPEAATLPWARWLAQDLRIYPGLAAATLQGAHAAWGAAALPLAREQDQRTTPDAVRLEAHRIFWAEDPGEALPRGRALLFREDPRARDTLRPGYVESVLALAPAEDALDLLLQCAADDGMEPRARLLAIRLLGERREPHAVPVLEGIFLSERANFLARREALVTLLVVDPDRGRALLARRLPDEQTDPALAELLGALREREGIVAG